MKNKILIAYYSMTSHTRRVAELIQNAVGGELASIRTKETYPSDYEAMVEQGRREVNEGFLPVLNEFPVDIDDFSGNAGVVVQYRSGDEKFPEKP